MQHNQNKKVVDSYIVSFFFCLLLSLSLSLPKKLFSQNTDSLSAFFVLKGNTQLVTGKSIADVNLELQKNGKTVAKFVSSKNGKFLIEMDISITNINNEYTLYVSKEGMISKTLSINTYIPKNEFLTHDYEQYEFFLEIVMNEKPKNQNVITKHSGTIQWSSNENKFILDEVFSKVIPKEKDTLETPPISTQTIIATSTPTIVPTITHTTIAEKHEIPHENKNDTNSTTTTAKIEKPAVSVEKKETNTSKQVEVTASKATIEIKKNSKVKPKAVNLNDFDGAAVYSINIERNFLNTKKKKGKNEQAQNSSTKYETENILTSMLDMVDEQNKLNKIK